MNIRVVDTRFRTKHLETRLPFKFGMHVLKQVPLAELSLLVEDPDGGSAWGHASDLLIPKWFEKNPNTTPEDDSAALAASVEAAAAIAKALGQAAGPHPVFELWSVVNVEQVGSRMHNDADVLVRGFGVSMVERALIDATCRLFVLPFHEALQSGALGFRSSRLIPETKHWSLKSLGTPVNGVTLRHTVGMLDPLTASDLGEDDRVNDGLPETLEDDIAAYGLHSFKIKVCGNSQHDSARLRAIGAVLKDRVQGPFTITLDGNEQCIDLESFAATLESLRNDDFAGALIDRLLLIEQPLPRRDTFDATTRDGIARLSKLAPVIIDEADTDKDAFRRAIDLGYRGVSIKACKGVFRAIANRALIDTRHHAGAKGLFQSGEDLTNLPSIPLQQDLALQSVLGTQHLERNGHHYFPGLRHLPEAARATVLRSSADIYTGDLDTARLRIENGQLSFGSVVQGVGLGGQLVSCCATENE